MKSKWIQYALIYGTMRELRHSKKPFLVLVGWAALVGLVLWAVAACVIAALIA